MSYRPSDTVITFQGVRLEPTDERDLYAIVHASGITYYPMRDRLAPYWLDAFASDDWYYHSAEAVLFDKLLRLDLPDHLRLAKGDE